MKKLFFFSDTAGRLEYFFIFLVLVVFLFFSAIVADANILRQFEQFGILGVVTSILLILVNISRRINDLGKSRYFILISFIPFVNFIFFLYLLFAPGKKIEKRSGHTSLKVDLMKILGIIGIISSVVHAAIKEAEGKTQLESIESVLVLFVISVILLFIGIIQDRREMKKLDKKIGIGKILVDNRLKVVPECQGDDYKQWTSCKGKAVYPEEGTYFGEFTNGKRWGKGIWTSADGTITKGTWKNDELIEKE